MKKTGIEKIGIIGSSYFGEDFNSPVKLKEYDKTKEVIVIEDKKTITINGIEYERIPQKPKEGGRKSSFLSVMMTAIQYTDNRAQKPKTKRLPIDNIEAEFELIQLKKSNLSRNDRDFVEASFRRIYRPVQK